MSEDARGEIGRDKGESDKVELNQTCKEGQYQARAREPVGEDGASQPAGEEMQYGRERTEELVLIRATRGQRGKQRM
jgi:hypothetical protein